MGLSVVTRARHTALVPRATVKDRLGIDPGDSSKDALLDGFIAEAGSAIVTALGFDLARQVYFETQLGTDSEELLLARRPVDPNQLVVTLDGAAINGFDVLQRRTGHLWRDERWSRQSRPLWAFSYPAGFLVPDAVRVWAVSQVYKTGEWARPTDSLSPLLFECTTAGSTSGSEPAWPGTPGQTVASGTVTFTARTADLLPECVSDFCWLAVQALYLARGRSSDLASITGDGHGQSYFSPAGGGLSAGLPSGLLERVGELREAL